MLSPSAMPNGKFNPEEYGYLVKDPLVIFHELSIFLNFLDCQTFFIGSTFNIGVGNEVYL